MHIQLLPPILPPHRTLSPEGPRVVLTPGQRVTATMLSPDLEGRSMIAFAGRELASRSPLPFPPGSTVVLEVISVEDEVPQMRVVPDEAEPEPPVAVGTYAYAAAVLAAGAGGDVPAAAQGLARWLPMLVARGILTQRQAEALVTSLGRVVVREPSGRGAGAGIARDIPSAEALSQALASRVAAEASALEARMSAALRREGPAGAERVLAEANRGRLAAISMSLREAAAQGRAGPDLQPDLAAAEQAVDALHEALLADQARVAAHFARDGVLALRLPLTVGTHDLDVHLRVSDQPEREPSASDEDRAMVHRAQLDLDLDGLGAVQVHLLITGHDVRVELLTAQPAAADALEVDLAALTTALTAAGFHEVLTRVAIDPVRVTARDVPLALPPEGSILQADA